MSVDLDYTEFILVWLWKNLLAYRNTLGFVPGTNQYWAISVKFLAQLNVGLILNLLNKLYANLHKFNIH